MDNSQQPQSQQPQQFQHPQQSSRSQSARTVSAIDRILVVEKQCLYFAVVGIGDGTFEISKEEEL